MSNSNTGRKIESKYETPIDDVTIAIAETLNTYIHCHFSTFVTPNVITSLSLLTRLAFVYFVYTNDFVIAAVLYAIAYLFDCMDGNYAKKYDMTTHFGDIYDHVSDLIKTVLLYIVILRSSTITVHQKMLFCVGSIVIGIFTILHLGAQELMYNRTLSFSSFSSSSQSSSLSLFVDAYNLVYGNTSDVSKVILTTKYGGCGSYVTFVVVFFIVCVTCCKCH